MATVYIGGASIDERGKARGGDTVPRRQRTGKCAVVHLPPSAGGTALFQKRCLAAQQCTKARGLLRATAVLLRHIHSVGGDHPLPLPLGGRPGCGKASQLLRAHRHQRMLLCQGRRPGLELGSAVVPAATAQQACGDQQSHVFPSMACRSRSSSCRRKGKR